MLGQQRRVLPTIKMGSMGFATCGNTGKGRVGGAQGVAGGWNMGSFWGGDVMERLRTYITEPVQQTEIHTARYNNQHNQICGTIQQNET